MSAVTSVPGQSSSSLLGMVARIVAMPVAGSTRVLDHGDLAVGALVVAGNDRLHGRGFGRDGLANVGKIFLRHREADVDGRSLIDGRHRRGVGLTHEIADLDVGHADAAGNRRADRAEAKLDLQIFELGAVRFRGRAGHVDLRSAHC